MPNTPADTTDRLVALEAHVAHQEKLLAELNEVVTRQWRKIDVLERHLIRLKEELQNVTPQRDGPEPPPPHY